MARRRVRPAAYARHRGVTRQAVHYALAKGIIRRGADGLIDIPAADRAWQANMHPIHGGERGRKGKPGKKRRVQTSAKPELHGLDRAPETGTPAAPPRRKRAEPTSSSPPSPSIEVPKPAAEAPEPPAPSAGQGLIDAKTTQAEWAGRLAELNYRERAGELLERDGVLRALADVARETRDALYAIPPRIMGVLAPEQPPFEVKQVLEEEIGKALSGLSRTLARMGVAEVA